MVGKERSFRVLAGTHGQWGEDMFIHALLGAHSSSQHPLHHAPCFPLWGSGNDSHDSQSPRSRAYPLTWSFRWVQWLLRRGSGSESRAQGTLSRAQETCVGIATCPSLESSKEEGGSRVGSSHGFRSPTEPLEEARTQEECL